MAAADGGQVSIAPRVVKCYGCKGAVRVEVLEATRAPAYLSVGADNRVVPAFGAYEVSCPCCGCRLNFPTYGFRGVLRLTPVEVP
jgi:hypothetical protein